MTEADWKLFKLIKDKAIEKYGSVCLAEYRGVIDDQSKNTHERYLLNYKLVKNRDKKMNSLFDGHSRSKAWLQLLVIRKESLADKQLVSQFTDEFRKSTDPEKFNDQNA